MHKILNRVLTLTLFRPAKLLPALMAVLQFGTTSLRAESPRDFALVSGKNAAVFIVENDTAHAVARAADDVRNDIELVTGVRPELVHQFPAKKTRQVVIAGVVGQSTLLDQLAANGKIDTRQLAGAWESFIVAVIADPFPDVDQALVIAGSDRRGAIYGLYEVSAMIGVSPWHWWADVTPEKKEILTIARGTHRFGPPSVKYRGIFINDEDWGLQPWAAKTFDPATGDIGPKTYAKVFELLLRLKANTLWPAMHPSTHAFNHFPEDKQVADDYGIVMGSSHAEPMLRNNVSEWTAPHEDYNYVTNRPGVLDYWEKRVAENARFENIYTLGMRGIHDSNMQGPKSDVERIQVLERIFADQRALIARYIKPELEQVPQMFCAYKEVLSLYRQGLRVPDDVTIVWPDDNFGYIRNCATAEERKRAGGFGVYYHLSYLGAPLSYLWLATTPPALVWEEMHKAYEHGADRIWIANVGDIKPAEVTMEFFLQMAWDIRRWRPDNLGEFIPDYVSRNIGPEHATEIAAILERYYQLNTQRKPEHLQWWRSRQPRVPSPLTDEEIQERLDAFRDIKSRVVALRAKIPAAKQAAYYQLVQYPIVGSALANERYFEAERGNVVAAQAANEKLVEETRFFNEKLSDGKWRGIMALEPADADWPTMRIERWSPPEAARKPVSSPAVGSYISLNAARFTACKSRHDVEWKIIPGLGRSGEAVTTIPSTFASIALTDALEKAPRLDYEVTFPKSGEFTLQVYLVPTHPISGHSLSLAVGVDDAPPQLVSLEVDDGGPGWSQGVLDAARLAKTALKVETPGAHTLRIYGIDPGVMLDKFVIDLGGLTPTYLGPASLR